MPRELDLSKYLINSIFLFRSFVFYSRLNQKYLMQAYFFSFLAHRRVCFLPPQPVLDVLFENMSKKLSAGARPLRCLHEPFNRKATGLPSPTCVRGETGMLRSQIGVYTLSLCPAATTLQLGITKQTPLWSVCFIL